MIAQHTRSVWISAMVLGMTGLSTVPQVHAGPINPPLGPISSTYKTLTQVEPRKDIAELAAGGGGVYQISAPGSYYLTANILPATGQSGISVTADNVTIDLNGFTIVGVGGTVGNGINAAARANVTIINGSVKGMGESGVFAGGATGCRFENLTITGNRLDGLWPGKNSTVNSVRCIDNGRNGFDSSSDAQVVYRDCTVKQAATAGTVGFNILADTQLVNCEVVGSGTGVAGGANNALENVSVSSAFAQGIRLGTGSRIHSSRVSASSIGLWVESQSLIDQCTASGNLNTTAGNAGIIANSGQCTISNCNVSGNSGGGIRLFGGDCIVRGCVVQGNGTAANAAGGIVSAANLGGFLIESNVVSNNNGRGVSIALGSQVNNNTVRNNSQDGIYVFVGCRVVGNMLDSNGIAPNQQAGILTDGSANFIADNFVTSNDLGIWCSAQGGNTVIRNTCRGNTGGNYSLFAGTLNGTLVNTIAAGTLNSNFDF